jgi:glycosyltransferase involved in cell wall biosynthesis
MPLPSPDELDVYARKGVELLLRTIGVAPEMNRARRLRRQWREHGADRPAGTPANPGTLVLFVCPRDWVEHVQVQAVLAQALRVRGVGVHLLRCGGGLEICDRANSYEAPPMPCTSCDRYTRLALDAHGLPHSTLRARWEAVVDDGWPELDEVGRAQLSSVEAEGLPLGRLVDIPLKWFLCAADLEEDPLSGPHGRAFLRSARRLARAFDRALDELRPDTVVLMSGLFLFEGIAWALCRARGIDVVTYERAFLKDTLVFQRGVPAGFYDFSADWPHAERPLSPDEEAELDEYLARRRRGGAFDQFWVFEDRPPPRGGGRLVSLFTNLTWDTAVIGRDNAFPGIREWLKASIDLFAERPEDTLVIRIHPSERHLPSKRTRDSLEEYVRTRLAPLPPNVVLVGAEDLTSSYPLMAESDLGLVYTSTTGLELALCGTPVVVAGSTHYRGKGFTVDVSSPEEFREAVTRVLADPAAAAPAVDAARRYAHFFFFRAPIPAPGVVEPLPGLARITVRSLAQLAPGADPILDRICEGILGGGSFVTPDRG